MSETILVAVPSENPGGLQAAPNAHFGHCPCYTIAKIENGEITETRVVPNNGHEEGGCAQPIKDLAKLGATALLSGGMGMKPLTAANEAGVKVYFSSGKLSVEDALKDFIQGKAPEFGKDQICKGCHGHH